MFFENANSMVKVTVILWEIYWSYSFEKGLREELVDYFRRGNQIPPKIN